MTNLRPTAPDVLLREIEDTQMTRDDVARTYADALLSKDKTDWQLVNSRIIERWSMYALKYIKTRAWKLVDSGVGS